MSAWRRHSNWPAYFSSQLLRAERTRSLRASCANKSTAALFRATCVRSCACCAFALFSYSSRNRHTKFVAPQPPQQTLIPFRAFCAADRQTVGRQDAAGEPPSCLCRMQAPHLPAAAAASFTRRLLVLVAALSVCLLAGRPAAQIKKQRDAGRPAAVAPLFAFGASCTRAANLLHPTGRASERLTCRAELSGAAAARRATREKKRIPAPAALL